MNTLIQLSPKRSVFVNLTRLEYFEPDVFAAPAGFHEQFMSAAIQLLLTPKCLLVEIPKRDDMPSERFHASEYVGRWAGDSVALVSADVTDGPLAGVWERCITAPPLEQLAALGNGKGLLDCITTPVLDALLETPTFYDFFTNVPVDNATLRNYYASSRRAVWTTVRPDAPIPQQLHSITGK
jgi:hypothetical protein